MPGLLSHCPARIVREFLIAKGHGTDAGAWPIKVNGEPDLPDDCITLYDVAGRDDGFVMFGEKQEWNGVQVRVRSANPETGWVKANAISILFDTGLAAGGNLVTIGAARYLLGSINRTGNVLPLGRDAPNSNRRLSTLDCLVSVTMLPLK